MIGESLLDNAALVFETAAIAMVAVSSINLRHRQVVRRWAERAGPLLSAARTATTGGTTISAQGTLQLGKRWPTTGSIVGDVADKGGAGLRSQGHRDLPQGRSPAAGR